MKKYIPMGILLFSGVANSGESWVRDAKITDVEFYGNQFTVYFDKTHTSTNCGHTRSVSIDTKTEPGKTHYSFFLMAFAANKLVSVRLTDTNCSGDRPTVIQIQSA